MTQSSLIDGRTYKTKPIFKDTILKEIFKDKLKYIKYLITKHINRYLQ